MPTISHFSLEEVILHIKPDAYLVEVECLSPNKKGRDRIDDLPRWIFEQNAIWLTTRKASICERAIEGEKIKERILRLYSGAAPLPDTA